jgi:hypothetical protein
MSGRLIIVHDAAGLAGVRLQPAKAGTPTGTADFCTLI